MTEGCHAVPRHVAGRTSNLVLAGVSQNNVLTTIRSTEAAADPTSAPVLEATVGWSCGPNVSSRTARSG